MLSPSQLLPGVLLRRRLRFLVDVRLENGAVVTAHTANTGSMRGCSAPGSPVWLLDTANPKRKYPYSLELVEAKPGVLVAVNTLRANAIVREAILAGKVAPLAGYDGLRGEVALGKRTRIDLVLTAAGKKPCYVEVKNVTMVEDGIACFPDAPSSRGRRHLQELARAAATGARAVAFFCVARGDARELRPAAAIDPGFAAGMRDAAAAGVELLAWSVKVTTRGVSLARPLEVVIA